MKVKLILIKVSSKEKAEELEQIYVKFIKTQKLFKQWFCHDHLGWA